MTSSIITLTTDFGTRDGYVGAMKGRILSIYPEAQILDLTHDLPPQDLHTTKSVLSRSLREFTLPAVHIAVVDPGVGSGRQALAAETRIGYLVGPDNGIFSGILEAHPPSQIFRIAEEGPCWRKHTSFDGLHLFSPVGAFLAQTGKIKALGQPLEAWVRLEEEKALPIPEGWSGKILGFDHFGNALTNLPGNRVLPGSQVRIHDQLLSGVEHYEKAASLEPAAFLINSDGMFELCVCSGSVKAKLSLEKNDEVFLLTKGEYLKS